MGKLLPANRVAAIVHVAVVWAGAVVAFITATSGTFPQGWQNTALSIASVIGGVVGSLPVVLKFLDGSQKYDVLKAQALTGAPGYVPIANVGTPSITPDLPYDAPQTWTPQSALAPEPASQDQPIVQQASPAGPTTP